MTALLYRPQPTTRVWLALVASALIHCAAIALAEIHRTEPLSDVGVVGPEAPEIQLDDPPAPEVAPAPPEAVETPPPVSPEDNLFPDNPPETVKAPSRVVRQGPPTVPHPAQSARGPAGKVLALSAPRPDYPYEARRAKITGEGVAVLTVDRSSGNVISVAMERSTGNAALDQAAIRGFSRWRFRPGTPMTVRCPITYTLTGAIL